MDKQFDKKGMVLVSILMVTVIILLLTTSLLMLHQNNLRFTNIFENQVVARKVAEAGVAYAIYSLEEDPDWQGDVGDEVTYYLPEVNGRFHISFDSSASYHSVNNLLNGMVPGGAFDGGSIPAYAVDLVITGTVERGSNDIIKRLRVVLQGDPYFDGALASGQIEVTADAMNVTRDSLLSSEPGTIHSNSVKPAGAPGTFAIDVETLNLYGGKASAQGEINPATVLDSVTGSTLEANTQGRHIKPLNIERYISEALASPSMAYLDVPAVAPPGSYAYIVRIDKLYVGNDPDDPNSWTEIAIPELTVQDGKLIINDDIRFQNGDVRFEFDHKYFEDNGLDPNLIAEAGIYMNSGTPEPPSVYVTDGDLTVAGPIKGNGSFYVKGSASYIGETNIVAPSDPGVAVLCNGDLKMQLPSITGSPLDLSMTGLVYSHENAEIAILDPLDDENPANNFVGGQWPPDWEDVYLGGSLSSTPDIAIPYPFGGNVGSISLDTDGTTATVSSTFIPPSHTIYTITPASGGAVTLTVDIGMAGVDPVTETTSGDIIVDPRGAPIASFIQINGHHFEIPGHSGAGAIAAMGLHGYVDIANITEFGGSGGTGSGVKEDPIFNIKGGLIAIDPANPVPTASNFDTDAAGNIKVDIGTGEVNIISSPQYLKLLHISKGAFKYRCVSWSEI